MFKKLVLASALTLALTSSVQAEEAKGTSIAVVNIPLIMSQLPQAKAEGEALQKEFGPRKAELDKIQQEGSKIEKELQTAKDAKVTELQRKLAQLKSEFELKAQALQEDSQKKQREAEMKLGRLIQTAIDRIAKEKAIDLVVRGESVVYASESVDISKDVIEKASKLKAVAKKSEAKK